MSNNKLTIEDLFTDSQPINEEEIVQILKQILVVERDNNQVHFLDQKSLKMEEKILAYGLAKKLLKIKGVIQEEEFSASQFRNETGLKKGSIDPAFSNLKDKYIAGKNKSYKVINYKINEILKMLKK